jgi:predicted ATP-grasp superfamily ATP-dependent carboligase
MSIEHKSRERLSVLIIDGDSGYARLVAHCLCVAPDLYVDVHIVCKDAASPLRFSRKCASFRVEPDGLDADDRIAFLGEVARKTKADLLMATGQPGIRFVAEHRSALSQFACVVPTPSVESFDTVTNKWQLTTLLEAHDIPFPKAVQFRRDAHFEQEVRALRFPVLLKATSLSGGNGITFFQDPEALLEHTRNDHGTEDPCPDEYFVQNFVPGFDEGISVLCSQGKILAYTIHRAIIPHHRQFGPAYFIDFVEDERALDVGQRVVAASQWNGVMNIDLRVASEDGQVNVLECNARYWANLHGALSAGVNFPYLACLVALGRPLPESTYHRGHFIHADAALRRTVKGVFVRQEPRFSWRETNWKFHVTDPFATVVQVLQRGRGQQGRGSSARV